MSTSQKAVEIILARQLASYLATPIFIIDPQGNLIYYNEYAERILGLRFDETGEMPASEWGTIFTPMTDDGTLILPENLPLFIAFNERHPAHSRFWICGLDNVKRHIEVTAFPLLGQGERYLGAVAIFWELPDDQR